MILRRLALFALLSFACDGSPALAAPPPSGSVQAVKVITCDGVETGTTNLTTVTVTGFPSYATQAWVVSVGDWFVLGPAMTAAQPEVVVAASDGRQWVRQFVPNPKWQTQTTWSIDESNVSGLASDENTCADDTHPCLNIDEFIRRMGSAGSINATVTVRWLSNTTKAVVTAKNIIPGMLGVSTPIPLLIFQGVPRIIRSGTLTGATVAPWTVSDSSLVTSWSASGCLSTSLTGTRLIRNVAQTKHAAMAYEGVAKTASTSPHNGYAPTFPQSGTAVAAFAAGDAYEVIALPKFPYIDLGIWFNGANLYYLDAQGIGGGINRAINCGFVGFAETQANAYPGYVFFLGALFLSGGELTGLAYSNRSMTLGVLQGSDWAGDLNSAINVVAKAGSLRMSHGARSRLGTVYVYDSTASEAILIDNNSAITIDAIHGTGNAGLIVNIRDSGCSINSGSTVPLSAFDAVTSAAHPISVVGTQYDYSAIPITVPSKNASFTTN